jgi:hypothetical protein
MKRQAAIPLLLPIAAVVVGAQSEVDKALPEVTALVQGAIQQQRLAESKEQDYVFREHVTINQLRKECTWAQKCPGDPTPGRPVGLRYEVLHYTALELEIFWLDGIRVARVMPTCQRCLICAGGVHMKIRSIIGVVGVLLLMAAMSPSVAAKDATVTLAISGMT